MFGESKRAGGKPVARTAKREQERTREKTNHLIWYFRHGLGFARLHRLIMCNITVLIMNIYAVHYTLFHISV